MDNGAFGLDLLCDRFMGEMLAVEEIFLVFKLVTSRTVPRSPKRRCKSEHEPQHSAPNGGN